MVPFIWGGWLFTTALVVLVEGPNLYFWVVVSLTAAICAWLHRHVKRDLDPVKGVVELDSDGLRAPRLQGTVKQFAWKDLHDMVVDTQGTPLVTFTLRSGEGAAGRKTTKVSLGLAPFLPADQERLVDALHRWRAWSAGAQAVPGTSDNELVATREYQDGLKALSPKTPATWTLVAINLLAWLACLLLGASVFDAPGEKLLSWGGNAASEVQKGEWWRMLTAMFLHSSLKHLILNLLVLYFIGTLVERIYGLRQYLIIYLGSGLLGSAVSLHFTAQHAVTVGASGAVFGIAGALLVAFLRSRGKVPPQSRRTMLLGTLFVIGFSLVDGMQDRAVDSAAHLGGLVGGIIAGAILPRRFAPGPFAESLATRTVVTLVLLTAVTVSIASQAPPAPFDAAKVFASERRLATLGADFRQAAAALIADLRASSAGELSEEEANRRLRSVHAPALEALAANLSLRPGDERAFTLQLVQRGARLLGEMAMLGVARDPSTNQLDSTDPARLDELGAELKVVMSKIPQAKKSD
jgi:rhomboid protease GluP